MLARERYRVAVTSLPLPPARNDFLFQNLNRFYVLDGGYLEEREEEFKPVAQLCCFQANRMLATVELLSF